MNPPPHTQHTQLSSSEVVSKSRSILKEYITSGEIEEVVASIVELGPGSKEKRFLVFQEAASMYVEQGEKERLALHKLFTNLFKKSKLLTRNDVENGLKELIEFAEDIAIDVPLLYTHFASLFAFLLSLDSFSLDYMMDAAWTPLRSSGKAAEVTVKTISGLKKLQGEEIAADTFAASSVDLKQLKNSCSDAEVQELLEKEGLTFLL